MYFKNYQGLLYKMSKMDPATVSKEACEANAAQLEKLANGFTDADDSHNKRLLIRGRYYDELTRTVSNVLG